MFKYITRAYHELLGHKRCLACETFYAKDAMREIWYRYTVNSDQLSSAVYLCEPCAKEIAQNVEEEIIGDDLDLDLGIEVDHDL